jgi:hypothetical protein
VSTSGRIIKRLLLEGATRSDRPAERLLAKRIARPSPAGGAPSPVAYAPGEIFLTLAVAGCFAMTHSWQIRLNVVLVVLVGLLVVLVVLVVLAVLAVLAVLDMGASCRRNVHAHLFGGGEHEVATVKLGRRAGLKFPSALQVPSALPAEQVCVAGGVEERFQGSGVASVRRGR